MVDVMPKIFIYLHIWLPRHQHYLIYHPLSVWCKQDISYLYNGALWPVLNCQNNSCIQILKFARTNNEWKVVKCSEIMLPDMIYRAHQGVPALNRALKTSDYVLHAFFLVYQIYWTQTLFFVRLSEKNSHQGSSNPIYVEYHRGAVAVVHLICVF